jgi:hypothetical protein
MNEPLTELELSASAMLSLLTWPQRCTVWRCRFPHESDPGLPGWRGLGCQCGRIPDQAACQPFFDVPEVSPLRPRFGPQKRGELGEGATKSGLGDPKNPAFDKIVSGLSGTFRADCRFAGTLA